MSLIENLQLVGLAPPVERIPPSHFQYLLLPELARGHGSTGATVTGSSEMDQPELRVPSGGLVVGCGFDPQMV